MRIEFFMPMKPPTVTHQEKKWRVVKGKPVPYEPPEVRAARSKLTAHLAGHRPVVPGIYVCMEQINARENCQAIANLEVLICAGCAEDGKWEWEYQNGAECPCTYCKRRAADCYHRPPEVSP